MGNTLPEREYRREQPRNIPGTSHRMSLLVSDQSWDGHIPVAPQPTPSPLHVGLGEYHHIRIPLRFLEWCNVVFSQW